MTAAERAALIKRIDTALEFYSVHEGPTDLLIDCRAALESAAPAEAALEAELEMSIGYVLDTSPPETLAGCYERIRNMQEVIRALAAPSADKGIEP